MSRFITTFPFDVEEFKELLPARSSIESVTWNPKLRQLEITWENPDRKTGLNVATVVSLKDLSYGKTHGPAKPVPLVPVPVDPSEPSEPASESAGENPPGTVIPEAEAEKIVSEALKKPRKGKAGK